VVKKVRWGIIGCAGIAKSAFIPAVRSSRFGVVEAVASRDPVKAKETAVQFGIARSYGSYDAILEDETVDAVYIPLPNHLHKEWTIKAARAGKHVLCEKPIALNALEANEMAAACEQAGVVFAEAFMYRHHPRYEMLREMLREGEIGEIRAIRGAFTYNSASSMNNPKLVQAWGGGAIYDIGVYPINAARYLLGKEPEAVTVHAFFSPDHDNVDMMASGLVEFPGSVALTFDCGMWAEQRAFMEIVGSLGYIRLPSGYGMRHDPITHIYVTVNGTTREIEVPYVNHYTIQADRFAESVLTGRPFPFDPSDAVANMRVVDACYKSARERSRVVL